MLRLGLNEAMGMLDGLGQVSVDKEIELRLRSMRAQIPRTKVDRVILEESLQ